MSVFFWLLLCYSFNLLSVGSSLVLVQFTHCGWLHVVFPHQGWKKNPFESHHWYFSSTGASTEANKTTECDVSYLYHLLLHCPNSSKSGVCAKQNAANASISEVVCNCSHGQCILNPHRKLRNEDSGLYFCRDESNYLYVNVNVLGLRKITYESTTCAIKCHYNKDCPSPTVVHLLLNSSPKNLSCVHQFDGCLCCFISAPFCTITSHGWLE